MVAWNSGATCDAFAASPSGWRQLLANITAAVADTGEVVGDVEPSHQQQKQRDISVITHKVDFEREPFWANFGSNTEVRTVYFHPAGSGEQPQQNKVREEVMSLKGLVLTVGLGIGSELAHLSPYSGVPARGWVIGESREKEKKDKEEKESSDDGDQASEFVTWEGRKASACLWIHYWKNTKAEKIFKSTQRRIKRPPLLPPLATEVFEHDLRRLGALGWEDYHVDFKKVPKTM